VIAAELHEFSAPTVLFQRPMVALPPAARAGCTESLIVP
jgi:hypothetical protein